jgi:hypothetical protein
MRSLKRYLLATIIYLLIHAYQTYNYEKLQFDYDNLYNELIGFTIFVTVMGVITIFFVELIFSFSLDLVSDIKNKASRITKMYSLASAMLIVYLFGLLCAYFAYLNYVAISL